MGKRPDLSEPYLAGKNQTYPVTTFERTSLHLTLIEQASLVTRLGRELNFFAVQLKYEWQLFTQDPAKHMRRRLLEFPKLMKQWMRMTNRVTGLLTSLTIVTTVTLVALFFDQAKTLDGTAQRENKEYDALITMLPAELPDAGSSSSFAAHGVGRVGLNSGRGEGSSDIRRRARGGGGGGDQSRSPAQTGAIPQPSNIPAPVLPTNPRNPSLPLAGVNIDPLLWKALPVAQYGDPRSLSQAKSNGPGSDGGMGDGVGQGFGKGKGPGFGPGEKGNTGTGSNQPGSGGIGGGPGCGSPGCWGDQYGQVFPMRDVTVRARVLSKPEPQYTEEARRNQITGTVTLRVVFARSGQVINIRAIHTLPLGLTERAIAAARQIKFVPALRNGQPVSVHMQLEYNFNLY